VGFCGNTVLVMGSYFRGGTNPIPPLVVANHRRNSFLAETINEDMTNPGDIT
jgi:hypothetical protein